jgi:hypothetical protein
VVGSTLVSFRSAELQRLASDDQSAAWLIRWHDDAELSLIGARSRRCGRGRSGTHRLRLGLSNEQHVAQQLPRRVSEVRHGLKWGHGPRALRGRAPLLGLWDHARSLNDPSEADRRSKGQTHPSSAVRHRSAKRARKPVCGRRADVTDATVLHDQNHNRGGFN